MANNFKLKTKSNVGITSENVYVVPNANPLTTSTTTKNKSSKLKLILLLLVVALGGVGYYAYSNNMF